MFTRKKYEVINKYDNVTRLVHESLKKINNFN